MQKIKGISEASISSRGDCPIKPDVIRNVSPSDSDYISAGAGLTCWGNKIVVSINKKDAQRIEVIRKPGYCDMTSTGPSSWARYRVEVFSKEPTHERIRETTFSALYTIRPIVDIFSDGSILFISQSSDDSIWKERGFENAFIYKDGGQKDKFCISEYPRSASIDVYDDIWVSPSDRSLESCLAILPRGEAEWEDLGELAPLCFDKDGHLRRSRMPWAEKDRERAELSCINIKDSRASVFFIKEHQMGMIFDNDIKPAPWAIKMMAQDLYAFAYDSKNLLILDFGRTIRFYKRDENAMNQVCEFPLDRSLFPLHSMSFAAGRGEELHFWSHNQWCIYKTESVRRQFDTWSSGKIGRSPIVSGDQSRDG